MNVSCSMNQRSGTGEARTRISQGAIFFEN